MILQLIIVLVLSVLVVQWRAKKSVPIGIKFPPGPKGFPVIGNALDMPKLNPWFTYTKWAKEYGAFA